MTCLRYLSLTVALVSTLLHLAEANAQTNREVLVGAELDYPPFVTLDDQGHPTGFSVELLQAIAKEMNLDMEIKVGPWSELRAAFERKELDILPNMAISEARKQHAAFSVPYVIVHGALFMREGAPAPASLEEVHNLRLIVMKGDMAHEYAESMGWCDPCIVVKTTPDAMRHLAEGHGDAVVAGQLLGMVTLKETGIRGIVPQEISLTGFVQKFAMAVQKDEDMLLAAINEGLALVKQKGIYDELYEQWLGVYYEPERVDVRAWLIRGAIGIGVLLLLMGLLMFIQMRRSLRRAVAQRTAALEAQITTRVRMEGELREAVLAAERANRAKTEFLSRASHEIRTPLTGIIGFADIMLEGERDPERQRYLGRIHECSHSLLQVVNDLLDLGKIELGTFQLEYEACQIRTEIEQVLGLFRALCDRRGVTLKSAVAEDVPEWLWLSRKHVRQILVNLVGNAVKFTAKGTVTVEVMVEPQKHADISLVLRVIDTGIGIPEALQDSLFEPFSRAQRDGVSNEIGTGLGLAICKQLCARMDASIDVTSKEGQGTTFVLRMLSRACRPLTITDEESPANGDLLIGARILVAEDNAINQMVIGHLLRGLGAEPVVVGNGQEALDVLGREHFDIALLDIQMPVLDGLSAARAIRQAHGDQIPLIAFSAGTMTQERMECLNSGMDDFVSKPVVRMQLVEVLSKWIRPPVSRIKSATEKAL